MVTFSLRQWFCFLTNLQVVAFASPIPCLLLLLFAVPLIWKKKICHTDKHNVIRNKTESYCPRNVNVVGQQGRKGVVWAARNSQLMPCTPESHPLDKARNIWYQQKPCCLQCLSLAVAGQHTHMTDLTIDAAWSWWKGNVERRACHSRRTSFFPRQLIVTAPQSQRHT